MESNEVRPPRRAAGFNPIMEVGEDFAFPGSQMGFCREDSKRCTWIKWLLELLESGCAGNGAGGGGQDGKIKILLPPKVPGLQLAARASICSSI